MSAGEQSFSGSRLVEGLTAELGAHGRTTPFTPRSGLVGLVHLSFDDHGSFRNLSVGFSPTQTSLRSNFNHDYLFKLPLQGAGCPIKSTVFYCTPCPVPSCPTYEPNSNDGE